MCGDIHHNQFMWIIKPIGDGWYWFNRIVRVFIDPYWAGLQLKRLLCITV